MNTIARLVVLFLTAQFTIAFPNDVKNQLADPGPRIIGGTLANLTEITYQASIQFGNPPSHVCGGVVISRDYVLTAAHCVYLDSNKIPALSNFKVALKTLAWKNGLIYNVIKITPHKNYKPATMNNDIALLKVSPISGRNNLPPIALRFTGTTAGETCTISGWGVTTASGNIPEYNLRRATVKIQDFKKCKNSYKSMVDLSTNMLCASGINTDSCAGDSGGPLVCDGELTGLVSFGYSCADPNYPGVYTHVAEYYDWIKENSAFSVKSSVLSVIMMSLITMYLQ